MSTRSLAAVVFALSLSLVLYELVLTRVFAIVLFAQFAHLAISLALLGVGVGALALHLFPRIVPDDADEERFAARLGWFSMVMAIAMVAAVWAAVSLPLTHPTEGDNFLARQKVMADLVDTRVLGALIVLLALPFACAGAAFAAVFRRARESIGLVYAADLTGGAMGCVLFLPALALVSGPDAVSISALFASAAALLAARAARLRALTIVSVVLVVVCGAAIVAGRQGSVLKIRYSAGFDEAGVLEDEWTPLTRVAVIESPGRAYIALDNSSRSEVFLTERRHAQWATEPYSLVFSLVRPPSRVAVLASGAGPDVVTALRAGHRDIVAIDLVPEFFDIMRTRYAKVPTNPYLAPGVRTVASDARSALMRETRRFDIIEMSQANFYGAGGLLAQAWQSSLLVTKEAFAGYLERLTDRGMISMYGSSATAWARNAAAALRDRGVRRPARQMAIVSLASGSRSVLLLKREPFTSEEVRHLEALAAQHGRRTVHHPLRPKRAFLRSLEPDRRILTDDRPHPDSWQGLVTATTAVFAGGDTRAVSPAQMLLRLLVVQVAILLGAGVLLMGLPLAWRGRREIRATRRAGPVLAYFAAIGYGYLAVEIVLLHKLVLFVGHPTYAITLVLFTLLVSSGLGSLLAGRIPSERVGRALVLALGSVVLLASLHAFVLSPLMTAHLLQLSLVARNAVVGVSLLPLGLVMGMSFPLALRRLPASGAQLVPWCWAVNGWMSVLAAVVTVLVARLEGYETAFVVALVAYGLAIPLSLRLSKLQDVVATEPEAGRSSAQ